MYTYMWQGIGIVNRMTEYALQIKVSVISYIMYIYSIMKIDYRTCNNEITMQKSPIRINGELLFLVTHNHHLFEK
jgi:hypothetical protein